MVEQNRPVIKRDVLGETGRKKRAPQYQLIGFERWTGGVETGIALDLEAADAIKDVDQAHFSDAVHQHPALGIELPFVVRVHISHRFRRWEVTMWDSAQGRFGRSTECWGQARSAEVLA